MKVEINIDDDLMDILNFLQHLQKRPESVERNLLDLILFGLLDIYDREGVDLPKHQVAVFYRLFDEMQDRLRKAKQA